MKYISKFYYTLIVLILVCTSLSTKSQSIADTTIYTFVELMPRYPGGNSTMHNFINTTINYPSTAILNNVTGKVYISIVVETDGHLSNIKVLKGIGSGCDEEAARIVSLMPNWNPGVHEEKNVRVSTTIPITFKKIRKTDGPIHNNADVLPIFTQSLFNFAYYIDSSLRYPVVISKENTIDTVNILYVVETDGSLSNVTIMDDKSEFAAFDFEAIRLMKELSGKFDPGYIDDMPVRVRLMVSLVFNYNDIDTVDCEIKSYSYDGVDYEYYIQNDPIYTVVESMPEFPGGMSNLMRFLGKNIKYPPKARSNNEQGRVFVNFVIEKDGSVSHAMVLRGVSPLIDAEALRVVNAMPKWIPGTQRGEPIRVTYNLPVKFTIQR